MANAQAQFALGIKGGPNFAKVDVNDPDASWKGRTGFHGGAFALIKLTKIGIQPEVIFSQQGSKVKFNSDDYDANFSYVNIPVILKLYTVAGINLQAGPQFGFLTTAESDYNPITHQPQTKADIKDAYKKSDVSVAIGAGWDLPFGLTIDARYNLGISKIEDDPSIEATKNQVFQVSLGFKLIKIGK
ncbi:MAG: hypothetical protein BroJett042_32420 [Bacteroidota bacterium]|nr:MAG: hypothetical protein BroJett042_32420 [Bacteroidota bacterium]